MSEELGKVVTGNGGEVDGIEGGDVGIISAVVNDGGMGDVGTGDLGIGNWMGWTGLLSTNVVAAVINGGHASQLESISDLLKDWGNEFCLEVGSLDFAVVAQENGDEGEGGDEVKLRPEAVVILRELVEKISGLGMVINTMREELEELRRNAGGADVERRRKWWCWN